MPRVGSRIREFRLLGSIRDRDQYSVRACADRAGIPSRSWAAYERGDMMPTADVAVKIAKALDVSVEDLQLRRAEQ